MWTEGKVLSQMATEYILHMCHVVYKPFLFLSDNCCSLRLCLTGRLSGVAPQRAGAVLPPRRSASAAGERTATQAALASGCSLGLEPSRRAWREGGVA